MYCKYCGKPDVVAGRYCSCCGKPVAPPLAQQTAAANKKKRKTPPKPVKDPETVQKQAENRALVGYVLMKIAKCIAFAVFGAVWFVLCLVFTLMKNQGGSLVRRRRKNTLF